MPELKLGRLEPPPMSCFYCHDSLTWTVKDGYVHSDGSIYVTYLGEDGEIRDDHCVLPIRPGHGQVPRTGRQPGEKEVPRQE